MWLIFSGGIKISFAIIEEYVDKGSGLDSAWNYVQEVEGE
jgi:hypothetical protein